MSQPTDQEELERYYAQLEDLETQIRGHERELVSRIVMSRKEEIAREAMITWLEEKLELLEAKIDALEAKLKN